MSELTLISKSVKKYTTDGYHRIQQYCQSRDVAIVLHDGFRSFREYTGILTEPEFSNVVLDIHSYQYFGCAEIDSDIYGHIRGTVADWKNEADDIIRDLSLSTYVGEWSLGLDSRFVSLWAKGPFNHALQDMDEFQMSVAYRGYTAAQIKSISAGFSGATRPKQRRHGVFVSAPTGGMHRQAQHERPVTHIDYSF